MTKDRINIRTDINTLTPSLGVEGTKAIKDLKRQMVLMKEKNIKVFNEEEEKYISSKIAKKPSKIGKIWRLCFK